MPPAPIIKSKGIGDVIAKVLKPFVTGSKWENCPKCKQRQEKLNTLIPFNPS